MKNVGHTDAEWNALLAETKAQPSRRMRFTGKTNVAEVVQRIVAGSDTRELPFINANQGREAIALLAQRLSMSDSDRDEALLDAGYGLLTVNATVLSLASRVRAKVHPLIAVKPAAPTAVAALPPKQPTPSAPVTPAPTATALAWTDEQLAEFVNAVSCGSPPRLNYTPGALSPREQNLRWCFFAGLNAPQISGELGQLSAKFGALPIAKGLDRVIRADRQARAAAFLKSK